MSAGHVWDGLAAARPRITLCTIARLEPVAGRGALCHNQPPCYNPWVRTSPWEDVGPGSHPRGAAPPDVEAKRTGMLRAANWSTSMEFELSAAGLNVEMLAWLR